MTTKTKAFLSVFFLSLIFFMMIDTTYFNAAGDYVVKFLGLKAWTGDYTGIHLTFFYFLPLFIAALFLVRKYAIRGLKIKSSKIFLIFIGLNVLFSIFTGFLAKNIKANAQGLFPISFEQEQSHYMEYEFEDNEYTQFSAEFTLTNYSKESKTFHLVIDNEYSDDDNFTPISFYDLDKNSAVFKLRGRESKTFLITSENYLIKGGYLNESDFESGSGSSDIYGILLFDDHGNGVKIDTNDFLGTSYKLDR